MCTWLGHTDIKSLQNLGKALCRGFTTLPLIKGTLEVCVLSQDPCLKVETHVKSADD